MIHLFSDFEETQATAPAKENSVQVAKAKKPQAPKEPKPPKPPKAPKPAKPRLPLTVLEEAWKEDFSKKMPSMPSPEFLTYGTNGGTRDFSYLHELLPASLEFIVSDPNEEIEVLFELELKDITCGDDKLFWARYDIHVTLEDTQCKEAASFYVRLGYPKVRTDIRPLGNVSLIHAQVMYMNALKKKGRGIGNRSIDDFLRTEVVGLFSLSLKGAPIHRAIQKPFIGWIVELAGIKIRVRWRWFSPYGFAFFSAQLADSEFESPVFYYAVDLGACMKDQPPRCYVYLWRMSHYLRLAWPEKPRINNALTQPEELAVFPDSDVDFDLTDSETPPEAAAPPAPEESTAAVKDALVFEGNLTKLFMRHYQELCQRIATQVLGCDLTADNCLEAAEIVNELFGKTLALWVVGVALPQMWGVGAVEEIGMDQANDGGKQAPTQTEEGNTPAPFDETPVTPEDELKRRYLEQLFGFKRKKKS